MPESDAPRPTPVTVIGWVWITIGALVLSRSVVNVILWRAIRPAYPMLTSIAGQPAGRNEGLDFLFEHFTAFNVAHAVLAVAVLCVAWRLLRLRPWARPAMRVVCSFSLIYVACFAAVFALAWWGVLPGTAGRALAMTTRRRLELAVSLALFLAFTTGLAAMIAVLGSAPVREAFRRAESLPHQEGR